MYIEDSKLYCYLPGVLLRTLMDDVRVLDALLVSLDVPGKPALLRKLSLVEKLGSIQAHAEYLRKSQTSLWRGVDLPEIMAGALWQSNLADRHVYEVFSAVKKENELLTHAANWLRNRGMTPFAEVPCGTKRPDVVGVKKGGFFSSDKAVAVELKNDPAQLKRGLDQMTTFGEYANEVWLACTPAMAAQYLDDHASARTVRHWDADLLNRKVRDFGFGLLVIAPRLEFTAEVVRPRERKPSAEKALELEDALKGRPEIR